MTTWQIIAALFLKSRAIPNVHFVFTSGLNSGPNSYSVFSQMAAVGPILNSGHMTSVSSLLVNFTSNTVGPIIH